MRLLSKIEKSHSFWFLIFTSVLFFFLRLPSLFEPYWYGDEGIYQALGILVRSGHPLYAGAWDNKPPLLYLIYALFNSDQFLTRLASLIFGLLSIWVFYLLAKELFEKKKIPELVTILYTFLFGIRLIEGNIANAENFMLFPIILAGLIIYKLQKNKYNNKYLLYFSSGLLLGIAFLLKIVAVFDFLAFCGFVFIVNVNSVKNFFKTIINYLLPIGLGFGLPIALTTIYYLATGHFKDFYTAILGSNVGYVGYGNKFIIPQGFLILKSGALGLFVLGLYIKSKSISKNVLFVLVWLAFALFNALFSQRPYTHYLLVLLPSFCLLFGIIFYNKVRTILGLIILGIVVVIVINNFNLSARMPNYLTNYYANFISFSLGNKNISDYQKFFDGNTPRDYEIATIIKANTTSEDSVFIWGNNAQVYKLANKVPISRYVVAYHITGFKGAEAEADKAIQKEKPKLIILMPNVGEYPFSLTGYSEIMEVQGVKFYEKIF